MNTSSCFNKIIVVMGGGVLGDGSLPPSVIARCEEVLKRDEPIASTLVVCSSSFSLNRPPRLTPSGFPRSEASTMASWLKCNGFGGAIACEQLSHDTVGSIYFTLSLYASHLQVSEVEFVTSQFHCQRVRFIVEFINDRVFSSWFTVSVTGVTDIDVALSRVEHEARSLDKFIAMFGSVQSHSQFLERLLFCHANYNQLFGSDTLVSDEMNY